MIIGNGLVASGLRSIDSDKFIFFASGVSNSGEKNINQFLREENLLREIMLHHLSCNKTLVYLSTCNVNDNRHTPYSSHKLRMETIVNACQSHAIFRLPQVVGKTNNPFTIVNHIYKNILERSKFQIWGHAKRSFIDIEDIAKMIKFGLESEAHLLGPVDIVNPKQNYIIDVVKVLEDITKICAEYSTLEKGDEILFDNKYSEYASKKLKIDFSDEYLSKILRKYYA
jgi:nucleoside-diphosphate-sugar epimerase